MSKSEFKHPFSDETFEEYCDNTAQIPNDVALNTWDYLISDETFEEYCDNTAQIPNEVALNIWNFLMPQLHNWVDAANLLHSNSEYYRGVCVEIGELLGEEVYICDDGTKSEDVLVAKLVEVLKKRLQC